MSRTTRATPPTSVMSITGQPLGSGGGGGASAIGIGASRTGGERTGRLRAASARVRDSVGASGEGQTSGQRLSDSDARIRAPGGNRWAMKLSGISTS